MLLNIHCVYHLKYGNIWKMSWIYRYNVYKLIDWFLLREILGEEEEKQDNGKVK